MFIYMCLSKSQLNWNIKINHMHESSKSRLRLTLKGEHVTETQVFGNNFFQMLDVKFSRRWLRKLPACDAV
jgi:hypothetical protein